MQVAGDDGKMAAPEDMARTILAYLDKRGFLRGD